jgi:VWFA-related protein
MNRALAVFALAAVLSSGLIAAQTTYLTRTVYVTVTDKDGQPVEDLTAADFDIREGGKTVSVTQAAVTTDPMQVALIVDDNGTGIFRSALTRFVQRLDGHAVMALSAVTGQTMKLVDYTPRTEAILKGVSTLNARPATHDGGQLLEGISEAAIELRRREAGRPVIIALTVGGEEHSTATADHVLDLLRRSGAVLHVFSVEGALRPMAALKRPDELLQGNMHLGRVLGDGSKQSGGRHQSIVASPGFIASLQNLALELIGQYKVTYTLPPGVKRAEKLNVAVKRKNLSVRAPAKLPT